MQPKVSLPSIVRFANTPDGRRLAVARQIREQSESDYSVSTDFWYRARRALSADRATTRDGAALEAAVGNVPERRRASYARVAAHWVEVLPRWELTSPVPAERSIVDLGGLAISSSPSFAEGDEHGAEDVYVWMNRQPLSASAIEVGLEVLFKARSDRTPVLVDLQRAAVHVGSPVILRRAEARVLREAASLARLLAEAA